MKKNVFIPLILVLLNTSPKCQIKKSNWLLSGNASFSKLNSSSEATAKFKQTSMQINPTIGYFVIDKFALGLRPSFTYASNTVGNSSTIIAVGPFARYYFLSTEKAFNLITEGSYGYGSITGKGQSSGFKTNTFSLSGGPVIYFNTSVGLEFLLSYSSIKVAGFSGHNNELRLGIGFQFHLEKDR